MVDGKKYEEWSFFDFCNVAQWHLNLFEYREPDWLIESLNREDVDGYIKYLVEANKEESHDLFGDVLSGITFELTFGEDGIDIDELVKIISEKFNMSEEMAKEEMHYEFTVNSWLEESMMISYYNRLEDDE